MGAESYSSSSQSSIQLESITVVTSHGDRTVTAERYGEFAVHPLIRGSFDDFRIATVTHVRTGYALMWFASFADARGFAQEVNDVPFDNAEHWIVSGTPDAKTMDALKELRDKWRGRRDVTNLIYEVNAAAHADRGA